MKRVNTYISRRWTVLVLLVVSPVCWSGARADFLVGDSVGAVFEVIAQDSKIWAGWSNQLLYSDNGGLSWHCFNTSNGFEPRLISAMTVNDTAFWAATYFDTTTQSGTYSLNGGIYKSDVDVTGWEHFIPPYPFSAGNITYDVVVDSDIIWTANWWKGLNKSTDGGVNWTTISSDTPASTGSYSWTIPDEVSSLCLLRIIDTSNPLVFDESNETFVIQQKPSITLISPNGGENWPAGTDQNITWDFTNVANVEIKFSTDNGSTWTTLTDSTSASSKLYSWTIPNFQF